MSASFAVIAAGGRQLRVAPGETIKIDRLASASGDKIDFDRVLLVSDGESVRVGTPQVEGAVVRAKVIDETRDPKVLVFKRKRRKQYRRTQGHRQRYTLVRIESIEPGK